MAFKTTAILVLCLLVLTNSLVTASPTKVNIGATENALQMPKLQKMAEIRTKQSRNVTDTPGGTGGSGGSGGSDGITGTGSASSQFSGSILACTAVGLTILSV